MLIGEPELLTPESTEAEVRAMRAEAHASRGLSVLGSPIAGTPDYIRTELRKTVHKAKEYVGEARRILLETSCPGSTGPAVMDYLQLMRVTLPSRFQHHVAACASPIVVEVGREFDEVVLEAYTSAIGPLCSPAADAADSDTMERIVQLDMWLGGKGFSSTIKYIHSTTVGAFGLSHHRA